MALLRWWQVVFETQDESKPGSPRSSPSAYVKSILARTASAACRSVSPSTNCNTSTSARRSGDQAGRPRDGNRSANSSSVNSGPSSSRTRIARFPFGNAARATRNAVERRFNRLKHFRGVATRYDKTATSYEAAVSLASILSQAAFSSLGSGGDRRQ